MIRFACPKCNKVYRAELDQAGRQMECKQCGAVVAIPVANGASGAVEPQMQPNPPRAEPVASQELDYSRSSESEDEIPIRSRRKSKSLPIGVLLVVGLTIVLALVTLVAVRRQSGEQSNSPAKVSAKERDRLNWQADERTTRAADAVSEAGFSLLQAMICFYFCVLVYFVLSILLAIWVIRDCRKRAEDYGFFWMLLIFPFNVVGLLIYLGARPRGNLSACENCDNLRLEYLMFCPHCRYDYQLNNGRTRRKY